MSEQYRCEKWGDGNCINSDKCDGEFESAVGICPYTQQHVYTIPIPASPSENAHTLTQAELDAAKSPAPQPMPWETFNTVKEVQGLEMAAKGSLEPFMIELQLAAARALFEAMEKDGTLELAHWWSEKDGHKIISCEPNCPVCKWKKLLKEGRQGDEHHPIPICYQKRHPTGARNPSRNLG